MPQNVIEKPYVIRIVGTPDHGQLETHERIGFDDPEKFENFQNVLDKHGVDYSPQVPLENH